MPDQKSNSLRYEFWLIGLFIILIIFTSLFNPVVNSVARSSGDCSLIKDYYQQTSCYIDLAVKEKNPEICSNVKNRGASENTCYTSVAKAKNDITVCENIKYDTGFSKSDCYNYFSNLPSADIKTCEAMSPDHYKETCYQIITKVSGNSDKCGLITSKNEKNTCYFSLAVSSSNLSMCEDVGADTFTSVLVLSDPTFNWQSVSTSYKNRCYHDIIQKLGNTSQCSLISDQRVKDDCYDSVARQQKNDLTCDNIKTVDVRDNCYIYVSDNLRGPEVKNICAKIQNKAKIQGWNWCAKI